MANRPVRPLINSEPISEFGAAQGDLPADGGGVDLLHVPGFSELRETRDIQIAEYRDGTRHGKDVIALPANVRWVAATVGTDGVVRSKKLMQAANKGYKPVTKDMLPDESGKSRVPWLTSLPPGAKVNPDGTISNAAGDLQLQWCDQPTAARNLARNARATESQIEGVGMNLGNGAEGITAAMSNHKGPGGEPLFTDAFVERKAAKP